MFLGKSHIRSGLKLFKLFLSRTLRHTYKLSLVQSRCNVRPRPCEKSGGNCPVGESVRVTGPASTQSALLPKSKSKFRIRIEPVSFKEAGPFALIGCLLTSPMTLQFPSATKGRELMGPTKNSHLLILITIKTLKFTHDD